MSAHDIAERPVAIVTGGGSGLGAAIAARLATDGAHHVAIADVDDAAAAMVAEEIGAAGGWASPHCVDVTVGAEVAALVGEIERAHRRLDVLVCSAAVETRSDLVATSDDEWQRVLDVNLKGPFLCMHHALPLMARDGGGSVVLMGSVLGAIGAPGYAAYCASKGALVNLAKQAAIEHAPDQIRVNVVAPSACDAGLFMRVSEQAPDPEAVRKMVARNTPMGRLGRAEEVAETVAFLASPGAAFMSGAVLPLDGGLAARRT